MLTSDWEQMIHYVIPFVSVSHLNAQRDIRRPCLLTFAGFSSFLDKSLYGLYLAESTIIRLVVTNNLPSPFFVEPVILNFISHFSTSMLSP